MQIHFEIKRVKTYTNFRLRPHRAKDDLWPGCDDCLRNYWHPTVLDYTCRLRQAVYEDHKVLLGVYPKVLLHEKLQESKKDGAYASKFKNITN